MLFSCHINLSWLYINSLTQSFECWITFIYTQRNYRQKGSVALKHVLSSMVLFLILWDLNSQMNFEYTAGIKRSIVQKLFLCSLIVFDRDKKFFKTKMKIMRLGMGKSLKTCIKTSLSLRLKQINGITIYQHNHNLKWRSHRHYWL